MKKGTGLKILRLAVSAGLIFYLLRQMDLTQVATHLKGVRAIFLWLALLMILLMIVSNSIRWKVVLRPKGLDLPFWRLFYFYLVSIFFSSFLPTSIGGDFIRIVGVARDTHRRSDALASVVIERLLGLAILLPILGFSLPFVLSRVTEWKVIGIAAAAVVCILVGFLLVLRRSVARRISILLTPLISRFRVLDLKQRLERFYEAIVTYSQHKVEVWQATALSLVARLLWILACLFVARAIDMRTALVSFLLVVPIVEVVRMIPITLSGIGLRETAFVVLLRQFGVPDALGFTFAVLLYLLFLGLGLVGGILYGTKQFFKRGN